jgi:hypothetical protein
VPESVWTARVVADTDATVPRIIVVALVELGALSAVAMLPFAALESLGREPFPVQPANIAKRAVTPIRRKAEMLETLIGALVLEMMIDQLAARVVLTPWIPNPH